MQRSDLAEFRAGVRRSDDGLLRLVSPLRDDDMRRPTLLPGWTVGHVLTHLSRNADSHRRMLDGAARGEQVPQYAPGSRDAEIEAGAPRTAAEITADLVDATTQLSATWDSLPDEAWDQSVRPRSGTFPAWTLVKLRWREVEIHRVDLNLGYTPAQWPGAYVRDEAAHVLDPTRLGSRLPAEVAVEATETDTARTWMAGRGAHVVRLSAPSWALLCWGIGRLTAAAGAITGQPPELTGSWL
jgi:maleylpyruvate isomerase